MLVECAPAERQRVGRCIWPISLVGWVFRRLSLRLLFVFFLVLTASPLSAQGHAVLDPGRSEVRPGWFGRSLALDLALSEPVPFRVFTLDAPPRLVVDLAGVDPQDAAGASVSGATADSLRIGRIGPGWARLVLALPGPLAIETAELVQDERAGQRLEVRLGRVSPEAFAAAAGAPPGVWPAGAPARAAPGVSGQKGLLVALDPGHGGIDPGAVREGVAEKDVVLAFAEALRTSLLAAGFRVMLTREGDDFVALDARTAMAAADGADVFLSIHSNAVADPAVAGAIAFTLSERGSTSAAASRAAAENAADRVAGLEGPASDASVQAALADLARIETGARASALARTLIARLAPVAGGPQAQPLQSANFRVLATARQPAVLLEIGFLSNAGDRARVGDPAWRADAAAAITAALLNSQRGRSE